MAFASLTKPRWLLDGFLCSARLCPLSIVIRGLTRIVLPSCPAAHPNSVGTARIVCFLVHPTVGHEATLEAGAEAGTAEAEPAAAAAPMEVSTATGEHVLFLLCRARSPAVEHSGTEQGCCWSVLVTHLAELCLLLWRELWNSSWLLLYGLASQRARTLLRSLCVAPTQGHEHSYLLTHSGLQTGYSEEIKRKVCALGAARAYLLPSCFSFWLEVVSAVATHVSGPFPFPSLAPESDIKVSLTE